MTKGEITQILVKEVEGLSANALQEVLDFVEFIKIKEWQETPTPVSNQQSMDDELRALDMHSLIHLEEEFANYKERYPYEECSRD